MLKQQVAIRTLALELSSNRNGDCNLKHTNGYLHSRRSPQTEAQRLAILLKEKASKTPLLVIGIGWGYLIDELYALSKEKIEQFIFFEPILECQSLLQKANRNTLWQKKGILYIENLYELSSKLPIITKNWNLYVTPSYARLFPELFQEIKTVLTVEPSEGIREETKVDTATANHFVHQWTRNTLCSIKKHTTLQYIQKSHNTSPCPSTHTSPSGQTPKTPLIIYCGAAPTLVGELKKIPKNAILIVSDTALAPVLANKHRVHLALCVDSGYATYYHLLAALRWQESGKLPLGFPVLTWSGGLVGLDKWFTKIYYYRSTLPLDQLLAEGPLQHCELWENPSRNVLGLALHVANNLGATSLYCLGATFTSDEKGRTHTPGTGYQEYTLANIQRNNSMEMYRPRVYAHKRKFKNILAWEGSQKLAQKLGMTLKTAQDLDKINHQDFAKTQEIEDETNIKFPETLSLETEEQRTFLHNAWKHLDFKQLAQVGLEQARLQRYWSFL